ncbi:MAG: hypothetical protein AB1797_09285 [bacterium]
MDDCLGHDGATTSHGLKLFVISPSPNPSHQGRGSSYADAVRTKGDET